VGVKLTQDEIDEFLSQAHTLILSTIRQSGEPFVTPLWFVYDDGKLFISTLKKSAKVKHILNDPRVCVLVEEGKKWIDLKAVIANCDAEIIEDKDMLKKVGEAMSQKYAEYRPKTSKQPDATKQHYASGSVVIRLTPRPGEVRSWYNRKIRMGP